jgi:DNA-binding beta-propeller fold protein YncE
VSTFAGGSSGCSDGVGLEAQFNCPVGVTIDEAGNLFVTDAYNNSIRKVTPNGLFLPYPHETKHDFMIQEL